MGRRDIVIATVARFHYDSLAIGLDRLGRLERFYSGLPRSRLRCPEIPPERLAIFPWLQVPYMALSRLGSVPLPRRTLARWAQRSLDRHIARTLPECAVYSAMSGCGVLSGAVAQGRGARFVCERGVGHIRHVDELMREEAERWGLPHDATDPGMIEREEAEYALADRLVVLAEANARTFLARGIPEEKIRVVPQAILPTGSPGPVDRGAGFRVLFVGGMNLRKGIGYLARAFRRAAIPEARLVMVGTPGEETEILLRGGDHARTERLGPLDHRRVLEEMRRAHVMVLPSLAEGAPLVALEALACGCPVIGTDAWCEGCFVRSGVNGLVVPVRDEEALAAALVRLHEDRDLLRAMSTAAPASVPHGGRPEEYADRWLAAVLD
ncbi:glycosyltransferase family 4 protein [Endothiovibrio diazotrophicus]